MRKTNQHTIDFIFPIALFFVFSSTALIALLLAANIYKNVVHTSNTAFEQRTALSYITGKIRQNDSGGTNDIYLSQFDGYDALTLVQDYGEKQYITHIYEAEGELKEIFLQEGVLASASSGTTIMQVEELKMKELSDGLFEFSCISTDGTSDSIVIGVHSNT